MQKRKSSVLSGHLPLKGKSAIIIEDNALVAIGAEFILQDAGAAVVRIANSVASAKRALDEGFPFDVALVDLYLGDRPGSACSPHRNRHSSKALYRPGPYQCSNEMRGGCAGWED